MQNQSYNKTERDRIESTESLKLKEKEDQIKQFAYYSNNPIKFIEDKFIGFNADNHKIENLPLYDFQKQVLESFFTDKKIFITKSRQMFFSTMIVQYLFYKIIFGIDQEILVVCPSRALAAGLKKRLTLALDHLPDFYKPEFRKDNETEIVSRNCRIQFVGGRTNAGKGYNITTLIFDEVAYVDEFYNMWAATAIALDATNGTTIMGTSLNNENVKFCNFYKGILDIKNNWKHIYLHWSENPLFNKNLMYDQEGKPYNDWYERQCILIPSLDTIRQELDCYFDPDLIEDRLRIKKQLKEEKLKDKIVTFRLDDTLEKQLSKLIIQRTLVDGKNFNMSDYIRELIKKDIDNNNL